MIGLLVLWQMRLGKLACFRNPCQKVSICRFHAQYSLPSIHLLPNSLTILLSYRGSILAAPSAQAAPEYVRAGVEAKLAKGCSEAIDP